MSRAAALEGQDEDDSLLGIDGVAFKLEEHSPFPVVTTRRSGKGGEKGFFFDEHRRRQRNAKRPVEQRWAVNSSCIRNSRRRSRS